MRRREIRPDVRCHCGQHPRSPNFRLYSTFVEMVTIRWTATAEVGNWMCPGCKTVITLTAGSLGLVSTCAA